MSALDTILTIILIIFVIIAAVALFFGLAYYQSKVTTCAEKYGGTVQQQGYCMYVVNGTSHSYSIWNENEKQKTK